MISLQIKNTKSFMNTLLVSEQFDSFEVEEATITTFNTFYIDGHIVKDFYTHEEIDEITTTENSFPLFSSWKDIKPICFNLIKGKKTPVSFKVILQASPSLIQKLAASEECEVEPNLIRSLVINIRYENGKVTCITATSFNTFIMDKSADRLWDNYVKLLFNKMQLDFEAN